MADSQYKVGHGVEWKSFKYSRFPKNMQAAMWCQDKMIAFWTHYCIFMLRLKRLKDISYWRLKYLTLSVCIVYVTGHEEIRISGPFWTLWNFSVSLLLSFLSFLRTLTLWDAGMFVVCQGGSCHFLCLSLFRGFAYGTKLLSLSFLLQALSFSEDII